LRPDGLHPTAAASFAEILRYRLGSVFCVLSFWTGNRGLGGFPSPHDDAYKCHFAQTFPFTPRDHPARAFHWLEADPRPGVEVDLRQVPLRGDPRHLAARWTRMEQAFGIREEQQAARGEAGGKPRFYICPAIDWPSFYRQDWLWHEPAPPRPGDLRAELARHLSDEARDWQADRQRITDAVSHISGPTPMIPRYGLVVESAAFEEMERLPCTAVGMWLFPSEAFKEPTDAQRNCFDVSAVRPGLILFEV
jgi:hypothetical protein